MTPKNRAKLLKIFEDLYPNPRSELNFEGDFQLLICVVLSAQCTDKKVNQVTPTLFSRFSSFEKLAKAKLSEVEQIIRPINYYKTKSKNLIALSELIVQSFDGKIPLNFSDITTLPGVGRKTASVVLGELGAEPTLPVDTHVFRVSQRLGLASGKAPDEIEQQLRKKFAPERWREIHHWLIFHGRRVCKAQRPLCSECRLAEICPSKKMVG